ncbi:MAG: nucleotidyl transferase AbiEii/AbiGii toxin family protein, partial [Flavobacteriales bacterium]|nr:nucleotidyl transferase AbiEii/AbiGii toxin family protein [Flavobacteriales bacterium]
MRTKFLQRKLSVRCCWEGLAKQKLSFVFKGGTALMLHFNSTKRLSIDIDIILPNDPDSYRNKDLESALDA